MDTRLTTAWIQDVRTAFELYRDGYILELSISPLASTPLVTACFLSADPVTPDASGRALGAVLHWAVKRLRPSGAPSWVAYQWRIYNILLHFYLRRMRASELAEKMAVSEQTIYDSRTAAFSEVARVLHEELVHPQDVEGRKLAFIAACYALLAPYEQTILRLLAVFRHPIPTALVARLVQERGQPVARRRDTSPDWRLTGLIASSLVVSDDERVSLLAHPEARPYLLTLLAPDERQVWHRVASRHYRAQRNYLEAAHHMRLAGQSQAAADLLITHHRTIMDDMHMEALRTLLGAFRQHEVSEATWAQLKIISGTIAEAMQDNDTAIEEYGKALGAPAVDVKALAYYRRGKVFKQQNIDQALVHYQHCIHLLESSGSKGTLLARAHMGRAWIFFEDRQDLARAAADLHQAQQIVDATDLETLAELHNAWGEFYFHAGDMTKARDHHLECQRIATEIQNVDLILKSLHNLGVIYGEQQQYQQGLEYLLKCRSLAEQTGDRRLEGLSTNSIGAYYFWLANDAQALHYYQRARAIFIEMGNRNWQAGVCYDLAEVCARLGAWEQASAFFHEGLAIAEELNIARCRHALNDLARAYPKLAWQRHELSERQHTILAFVQAQGAIKSTECARLIDLSKEQAIRELNELVEKQILIRVGAARATRYVLPES